MKEVIIDGVVYVPKETKTELDLLKEKYETGDYILVRNTLNNKNYFIDEKFYYQCGVNVKLINKKHKDILDAWLANNSVEIEYEFDEETYNNAGWYNVTSFIDEYKEQRNYRLKQQYPIFKRNKDNEVFKITSSDSFSTQYKTMLCEDFKERHILSGEEIPYDKERGLYHLQPVFMWDDWSKTREINFFKIGKEYTVSNIEPITPEQLKVMPFVWDMYQQILKDTK